MSSGPGALLFPVFERACRMALIVLRCAGR